MVSLLWLIVHLIAIMILNIRALLLRLSSKRKWELVEFLASLQCRILLWLILLQGESGKNMANGAFWRYKTNSSIYWKGFELWWNKTRNFISSLESTEFAWKITILFYFFTDSGYIFYTDKSNWGLNFDKRYGQK